MFFISSFDITSVVLPDPRSFYWISAFVADTAAFDFNGNTIVGVYLSSVGNQLSVMVQEV